MAAVDRFKGADIPIKIGLLDKDKNSVNIDNLAELYVFVIRTKTSVTVAKFSKAGTGEFETLVKDTATSYIAKWLSGNTKVSTPGDYHVEANVAETDSDYESSLKNTLASDKIVNLKESTAKSESSG